MSFAGVHPLVLHRDGACLREGVARRPWMAGGMGTDGSHLTAMINLRNQLTSAQSRQPDWVRKLRRSIKGSDTPQTKPPPTSQTKLPTSTTRPRSNRAGRSRPASSKAPADTSSKTVWTSPAPAGDSPAPKPASNYEPSKPTVTSRPTGTTTSPKNDTTSTKPATTTTSPRTATRSPTLRSLEKSRTRRPKRFATDATDCCTPLAASRSTPAAWACAPKPTGYRHSNCRRLRGSKRCLHPTARKLTSASAQSLAPSSAGIAVSKTERLEFAAWRCAGPYRDARRRP